MDICLILYIPQSADAHMFYHLGDFFHIFCICYQSNFTIHLQHLEHLFWIKKSLEILYNFMYQLYVFYT